MVKFVSQEFIMNRVIKFIKVNNRWYADLPDYLEGGGDFADCEMVLGADRLLDFLSCCGKEMTIEVCDDDSTGIYDVYLRSLGADDVVTGMDYQYDVDLIKKDKFTPHMTGILWLCDVTKFVFDGAFPDNIYMTIKI